MLLWKKLVDSFSLTTTAAAAHSGFDWPDLPTTGFMTGRPSTADDVKNGSAVFSMDGKSLGTLKISVPQYVWWSDEDGKKFPMILVQAERAPDNTEIVGLRNFDGQKTVATLPELVLLGTKRPN